MDRIADNGKKLPLLVVGELPAAPAGAGTLAPMASRSDINDFYVVVALPAPELSSALAALAAAGLSADQIIVHAPAELAPPGRESAGYGLLERLDCESADELRGRLAAKVESQRQKKLLAALRLAQEADLVRRLTDAEITRTLDTVRIAHALACEFALGPAAHARTLRACLDPALAPKGPWSGDPPAEHLIPEVAATVVDAFLRGASCREAIRERAAGLSFRLRAELLHRVENCVGPLLGGRHAA